MTCKLLALFIAPLMAASVPTVKDVNGVLASYRQAKAIKAKVKKTVETMVGMEMKSQGDFYFSKGKMRMEMMEPEHTVLVYDGKNVWFEQRVDDKHIQVTKMRAMELRKSDSILAALFERQDVLKNFDLKKSGEVKNKMTFLFEAKDKKKSDIQSMDISLLDKNIQKISYKDQLENRVTLEFSDLIKGEVPAAKFAYVPPKNAEVTEP